MRAPDRAAEVATSGSGGIFDGDTGNHNDYRARAQQHAPRTPEEIRRAAHDLAADGHGDHGIADILQAHVDSVRRLLGERK